MTKLPVPGYIHRPRPDVHGGVATLVVESVDVVGDEVRAVVVTWDGPLCPLPSGDELVGPFDWADDEAPTQAEVCSWPPPPTPAAGATPRGGTATLPPGREPYGRLAQLARAPPLQGGGQGVRIS